MGDTTKVSGLRTQGGWAAYRSLMYGKMTTGAALWAECLTAVLGGMPGAAGLFLRGQCYPCLLGQCGRGVVFGRHLVLRHPRKIRLGEGVILDDHVVIDAKGEDNEGIHLDDAVFIGRGTIVYCKGGDILLAPGVNVSSRCTLFSSHRLTIGAGTVIGAYSYLLSGGEYDPSDAMPFAEQSGKVTRGPLHVGADCWLGARVTVLDAATLGDGCVIGAGAVVTKPLPAHVIAAGVPARVIRQRRVDSN